MDRIGEDKVQMQQAEGAALHRGRHRTAKSSRITIRSYVLQWKEVRELIREDLKTQFGINEFAFSDEQPPKLTFTKPRKLRLSADGRMSRSARSKILSAKKK